MFTMNNFNGDFHNTINACNLINNNVVLVVNNQRFPCDKICLQNASPYFQAMFNSCMKESTAGEVNIRDVESDVFKVLLDYAHNNHLPVFTSKENDFNSTCELLKAACIFQFDEVSKQCCKYLTSIMDVSNCLKLWDLADVLGLPELRSKAKSHALWYGQQTLESDEIFETNFETFFEIVSQDTLIVKSELQVIQVLMNWIKENGIDHEKSLKLFKEIRLDDISPDDRKKIPKDIRRLITSHDVNTVWNERKQSPFETFCKRPLKTRLAPLTPLLYGYSFHGRKNKLNIQLHIQEDMHFLEISSICVYFKTLTGFGVCIVGKDVYMFGGREKIHSGKWNQQMWKYDSLKGKWTVMSQIPFCRRAFQCLVLNNWIYVLGGYGEYRAVQTSVLCYDVESGVWSEKASPPQNFSFVAVSGTYQGSPVIFHFAKSLHIYQPTSDVWVELTNVNVVTGIQNAVDYEGLIYLMTQEPHGNGTMIYLYNPDKAEVTPIAKSLSEDCTNFTVLNGKIFIYTDNGVEIITAPSADNCGGQVMFKWRNEQRKPLSAHLKFVGLLPFYRK